MALIVFVSELCVKIAPDPLCLCVCVCWLVVEHAIFGENYALKITHWIHLIYMLSVFMDALFETKNELYAKQYKYNELIENAFMQKFNTQIRIQFGRRT